MDIVSIIIQLVVGALGGNAAGTALKEKSLGGTGNSIAGAIGGLVLGQIVERLTGGAVPAEAIASSGLDIGSLITNVISSGAGGAILTAIVAMIKNR
jgi:uncharacterized membrane protein YeaQ/YmgE (transglycosylase-associated protein family)